MTRPGKQEKPVPPKDSKLTVLWQVEMRYRNGKGYSQWLCQCKCGKSVKVLRIRIQSGHTRSCGCLHDNQSKLNIRRAQEAWVEQAKQRRLQSAQ